MGGLNRHIFDHVICLHIQLKKERKKIGTYLIDICIYSPMNSFLFTCSFSSLLFLLQCSVHESDASVLIVSVPAFWCSQGSFRLFWSYCFFLLSFPLLFSLLNFSSFFSFLLIPVLREIMTLIYFHVFSRTTKRTYHQQRSAKQKESGDVMSDMTIMTEKEGSQQFPKVQKALRMSILSSMPICTCRRRRRDISPRATSQPQSEETEEKRQISFFPPPKQLA